MNTGWRALEQGGQILAYSWDGSGSSSVSILDAATGRLLRTTPADVAVHGAVVDPESWRAFVSAYDLHDEGIGVLRAATRRSLPLSEIPGRPIAVASDARAHRAIIVSEVDEPGTAVSVYDTASGRFIQDFDIGSVFGRRSLAVDERTGRAFIATMSLAANTGLSGSVIVLDTHTGSLLHTVALPYAPGALAVDAQDGRVFVSSLGLTNPSAPQRTRTGTVSMLDARTGALLHSSTVGAAPGPLAVDARHHHILALTAGPLDASGNANGPGTIVVLDGRSGAVLRTIAAGMAPGDIAVDERANRALVLNFGGTVRSPDPWGWLPQGLRRLAAFLPGAGTHTVRGSVIVLDTARL
jgi:DNA-binding beta-propeller fold protein YncE